MTNVFVVDFSTYLVFDEFFCSVCSIKLWEAPNGSKKLYLMSGMLDSSKVCPVLMFWAHLDVIFLFRHVLVSSWERDSYSMNLS